MSTCWFTQTKKLNSMLSVHSAIATMYSPEYMMFDTGAAVHVCPLWFCNDYPVYTPYYHTSRKGALGEEIQVYGLRTVRMHLREDPRTEVYVQFVATDVTEPIMSYMTIRASGVKVDLSQPEHPILPCDDKVPLEQHFTNLYFKIYQRVPATAVEYNNNMITSSVHAEPPLHVCPMYIKSTLKRTTGGNTECWEFYNQSNTLRRVHRCHIRALIVPTSNTFP